MKRTLLVLITLMISIHLQASESSAAPSHAADRLFAPDHLIQIEVKMDPQDWHALRISHRVTGENFSKIVERPYEYYPADVVIDGRKLNSVGIRKKGFFGSAISTRPSLKIKMNKYVDDQVFNGLGMMTFNNNNQDPTQAQSFLVYQFMNKAGAKSPRSNFARIKVNGEDLGIYTHVESVREPFIERLFKESQGDLWEGYAGDFTNSDFNRIVHKWGEDADGVSLQALYDLLQSPGPISVDEFEKLIDLDAFITLWASEVLIGHWDGYASNRNNFYIYRDPDSGLFYFIPWGPDSAFWDPGPFLQQGLPKSFKARGYLCKRLWELPPVRIRYRTEMRRLLNEAWDEKEMLAELKQARTLTQKFSSVSNEAEERGSQSITKFIENRRQEVQAELDLPATDWPETGGSVTDTGPGSLMEISGDFSSVFEIPEVKADDQAQTESPSLFAIIPANLPGKGKASIEFTVDDTLQQPFTHFGVRTTPGYSQYIRKGYPVIEIMATSDSGHPPWRLSLILDPHQLVEGRNQLEVDHFSVWAQMIQGDPSSPEAQTLAFGISGTLELDEFSRQPGAPVSGRFRLQAPAFKAEK
jgi:hypothetical protein